MLQTSVTGTFDIGSTVNNPFLRVAASFPATLLNLNMAENFSSGSWTKTGLTVSANTGTDPLGINAGSASRINGHASTDSIYYATSNSGTGAYEFQVWLKCQCTVSGTEVDTIFIKDNLGADFVKKAITVTQNYQCYFVTLSTSGANTTKTCGIKTGSDTLFAWGAQFAIGSTITPYFPGGSYYSNFKPGVVINATAVANNGGYPNIYVRDQWTEISYAQLQNLSSLPAIGLIGYDGNNSLTTEANGQIVATATNDDAAAGKVGENLTGSGQSAYTNYTTTTTYQALDSITLTAGDWDLTCNYTISANSATVTTTSNAIFAISTTRASASGTTEGIGDIVYIDENFLASSKQSGMMHIRKSVSGSTKVYLNSQSAFSVGNPQYVCGMRARRMR